MTSLPPEVMKKLQEEYIATFPTKLQILRDGSAKNDLAILKQQFHKLAGSGSTYSMPEITQLGRASEEYIGRNAKPDKQILDQAIDLMASIFESQKKGVAHPIDGHPLLKKLGT